MTRNKPNYHDDPRLEVEDYRITGSINPPAEAERRTVRRGADSVREAMGSTALHPKEAKIEFVSEEAKRIEKLIQNSDLTKPQLKRIICELIEKAQTNNLLNEGENEGLLHYLDHAEGLSDSLDRELDWRERQVK